MYRHPMVLTLALAGWASALVGQQADPDVVRLSFAWPAGTAAEVETVQRMVRSGDGTDSDITIRGSYGISVEQHPEGLVIHHTPFRTTEFHSVPELPADNPLSLLYSRIGTVTPDYVISPGGELLAVEGVEEMGARMREALLPLADSMPEQAEALTAMLGQLTSREFLFAQIEEQWNGMVGTWLDAEFEVGATYELEEEAPSPLMPQMMIPFLYLFTAVERTPCSDADVALSCVLLEMESCPDPDVLQQLTEQWIAQAGPDVDGQITSMEQETILRLVAEPGTLLPHRWETERVVRVTGTEQGAPSEALRSDVTVLTFRYR